MIQADHLPEEVLLRMETDKQVVNAKSKSVHQLTTLGVVTLNVRFKGYYCRQPFLVVRKLTSDVILGKAFINEHVETIKIRQCRLILVDGTEVPIERHAAWKHPTYSRTKEEQLVRVKYPKEPHIYVTKLVMMTPQSEKSCIGNDQRTWDVHFGK